MLKATIHKPESEIKNYLQTNAILDRQDLDLTKRQFIRLNYKIKVTLSLPSRHQAIQAYADNVSESGLFINTDKIIPVGTEVNIQLYPHKGEEVSVAGKVVWINESADKDNAGYAVFTPTINLLSLLNLDCAFESSRREFIRINRHMRAVLIFQNGKKKKIKGVTQNISYQGLFIKASKLLPVYSVVTIRLYPYEQEGIELKGAVVRQTDTSDPNNRGMGLYISTEVDPAIPGVDHEKRGEMIQRYIEYINKIKQKAL